MPDSNQICDYRQCIYDQYLSKEVRPGGQPSSAKEYQRWADATEARLRGWLPADRHTPVLDLGCGPGNFLFLMEKLGYTNLTGVDLSGEQIEMARQWCPRATLIHGDVKEFLAENPDKFGLITGFDIIEHFTKSEIMPFIKQIARALSTGGRLILQTPNAESPWGLMHRYGDFTHEIAFTPRSLEHVLRMNGFTGFASAGVRTSRPRNQEPHPVFGLAVHSVGVAHLEPGGNWRRGQRRLYENFYPYGGKALMSFTWSDYMG